MAQTQQARLEGVIAATRSGVAGGLALPPVHLWNPPLSGDIDILIRKDGAWLHEGGIIGREALVRLFSRILRREGDETFLVTPVEKWRIRVEDAPFTAVRVDRVGDDLSFLTNVGDEVVAGPDHPIRVQAAADGAPRPYLGVRGGLEALITRPVFYELANLAEERAGELGVQSGGAWFPIGQAGDGR